MFTNKIYCGNLIYTVEKNKCTGGESLNQTSVYYALKSLLLG